MEEIVKREDRLDILCNEKNTSGTIVTAADNNVNTATATAANATTITTKSTTTSNNSRYLFNIIN